MAIYFLAAAAAAQCSTTIYSSALSSLIAYVADLFSVTIQLLL